MRREALWWTGLVMLGAGSYWAPRPWRIGAVLLLVGVTVLWERRRGMRQLVEFGRRLRHRQSNHLQVVSGWLDLGRDDRARAYLEAVLARGGEEAQWYRELPLSWLHAVLALDAMGEARGLRLEWHVSRMRPDWLLTLRFRDAATQAMGVAGSTVGLYLEPRGFVISLPDAKQVPRPKWGVRIFADGETMVLSWQGRGREIRSRGVGV